MKKEKRIVRKIEILTNVHATEDDAKVRKAILNLVPSELRDKVKIKQLTFQGHYGNPIKRLILTIIGDHADKVFKNIILRMTETDRRIIDTTLDNRLTSSHLYIRLSKQEAYQGNIVLYEGDDVIKIVAALDRNVSKEDLRSILRGKIESDR